MEGGESDSGVMTQKDITIITICKNAESVIAGTMKSVLAQSYPSIEYIVIDGRSTDRTLDIVKDMAAQYPSRDIKVRSEPDSGISDAMNKGIKYANGKIINHLHAGDKYIDNAVIDKVMKSHDHIKWRWAVAGSIAVDPSGKPLHLFKAEPDYRVLLKKNCVPHQSTFLVKDIFDKHGLFDVNYKQAMDYEYWLRIAFKGNERYVVLPFNTTYFMEGGRSSNIIELLRYIIMLRKSMRAYGCKTSALSDVIFIARIVAFYILLKIKRVAN